MAQDEKGVRVLLIEDDPHDSKLFREALEDSYLQHFSCTIATEVKDAIGCLLNTSFDVIVTDLNLPDSRNLDTVNDLLKAACKTPVVILSGSEDDELVLQAVHVGVEEYISKRYLHDSSLIVRTLRHAVERHRLKLGIEAIRDREHLLANYDPITRLPNRLLFLDRLSQAVLQSQRNNECFTLCFLDLDRFKSVNDTLGHGAGDEVLRTVSKRLSTLIRDSDTAARLGGDEFTLILRQTHRQADLAKIAQQVIDLVNVPINLGQKTCSVGVSMGLTCYPRHGTTPSQLLKNADMAMYEAKNRGRNQYHFFSPLLSRQQQQAYEQEMSLKETLQGLAGSFALAYQPKVNLLNGRISSVEALLRWHHPALGAVSPADFIPMAEESGLLAQIDEWVLRRACLQLQQWQDRDEWLSICINLSGRSFNDDCFLGSTLVAVLEEYKVPGHRLEIEITEHMLLENLKEVEKRLTALKNLGIRIAIDDFGTGFSSLSYLSRLPIDTLKIDGAFIRHVDTNPKDQAVLKAIVSLGRALELNVVAECIETDAQKQRLKELGCNEGQGFLWGEPSTDWQPKPVLPGKSDIKLMG
ncbi:EAL domain-containing protein [Exilibacterium tricleocarpae]|uniref:EAL domain-containing protein n=1 Tax=Exilibacterium tricleocarpae TaxID=2591008 RepID=A0A545U8A7_9GAMM|nr:GGDEF domain-containing response regulator [Exilibacterium tricleocarpae]TQV85689.1 EAL domain-containing protein [Exilibacterium tricleocarpae]